MYVTAEFSTCAVLQLMFVLCLVTVQVISMVCAGLLFTPKLVFHFLKSQRLVSYSHLLNAIFRNRFRDEKTCFFLQSHVQAISHHI